VKLLGHLKYVNASLVTVFSLQNEKSQDFEYQFDILSEVLLFQIIFCFKILS